MASLGTDQRRRCSGDVAASVGRSSSTARFPARTSESVLIPQRCSGLTRHAGGIWTRLGVAASVKDGRRSDSVLWILPIAAAASATLLRRRRSSLVIRSLRRHRRTTTSILDSHLLPLSSPSRYSPSRQSASATTSSQYLALRLAHLFRKYLRSEKFTRNALSTTSAVSATIFPESSAVVLVESIRSFSAWIAVLSESESTTAAEDGRDSFAALVGYRHHWSGSAAGETTSWGNLASLRVSWNVTIFFAHFLRRSMCCDG